MKKTRRGFLRVAPLSIPAIAGCAIPKENEETSSNSSPTQPASSTESDKGTISPNSTATRTPEKPEDEALRILNRTSKEYCIQLLISEEDTENTHSASGFYRSPPQSNLKFSNFDAGKEYKIEIDISGREGISRRWMVESCGDLGGRANKAGNVAIYDDETTFYTLTCDVEVRSIEELTLIRSPSESNCSIH
jgi:hypothetical protein